MTVNYAPGVHASAELNRAERENLFQEAHRFMADRTHPDELAARLNTTRLALERRAQRWGHHDLARYVAPTRYRGQCHTCGAPVTSRATVACLDCYTPHKLGGPKT